MTAKQIIQLSIACLAILVGACKKKNNSSSTTNNLGYTGLKTLTLTTYYSQKDSSFAGSVTWTLQYDGEKLTGAVPDKFKNRLGTIKFAYDANDRPISIQELALSPTADTFMNLRFDLQYDNYGRVAVVNYAKGNVAIPLPYAFLYDNLQLKGIVKGIFSGGHFVFDTTRNLLTNNEGDITFMRANTGVNLDYILTDTVNTLHNSLPVWLLLQMTEGTFDNGRYPIHTNRKLVSSLVQNTSGGTYYYYNYLFDTKGNVKRRIKTIPGYPPSMYDTTTYTYY